MVPLETFITAMSYLYYNALKTRTLRRFVPAFKYSFFGYFADFRVRWFGKIYRSWSRETRETPSSRAQKATIYIIVQNEFQLNLIQRDNKRAEQMMTDLSRKNITPCLNTFKIFKKQDIFFWKSLMITVTFRIEKTNFCFLANLALDFCWRCEFLNRRALC